MKSTMKVSIDGIGLIEIVPERMRERMPTNAQNTLLLDRFIQYHAFCDDFGPVNLASILNFCDALDASKARSTTPATLVIPSDAISVTNSVFLIGSYLVLRQNKSVDDAESACGPIAQSLMSYRDVSPGSPHLLLTVRDCWSGVLRARDLGWVSQYDVGDYESLDNPLNADLHEVVPGKFLAFKGPLALRGGATFLDQPHAARSFSPAHYVDILRQFDVQAVVRLNEPQYDAREFERHGLCVVDLAFDDCACPPFKVVAKFLAIAEGIPGALAVHCKAGLGRTGTLIAMYMMKHHGFTAREAMAWLRIVRPGSVIGEQQEYLCGAEASLWRAGEGFRRLRGPLRGVARGAGVEEVRGFVACAERMTDRRFDSLRAADEPEHGTSPPSAVSASEPLSPAAASIVTVMVPHEEGWFAHESAAASRRGLLSDPAFSTSASDVRARDHLAAAAAAAAAASRTAGGRRSSMSDAERLGLAHGVAEGATCRGRLRALLALRDG